jgi:ATP-dependent DNA helicase PIF1
MDETSLTDEQYYVLDLFKEGKNLFITGPGGVGKSHLINTLVHYCNRVNKPVQVCALTGCAAVLLGGKAKTIHSWSGINFCDGKNSELISKALNRYIIKMNWKKTQVLIVDEVSMMSKKMIMVLEEMARKARNSIKVFGGIQVVFCGDFYQLPPVCKDKSDNSKFCFEANIWSTIFPLDQQIQLTHIFRQKDKAYLELLSQVREGTISAKNIKILKERMHVATPKGITQLSPIKSRVNSINDARFKALASDEHECVMTIEYNTYKYIRSGKSIEPELLRKGKSLTPAQKEMAVNKLLTNSKGEKVMVLKVGSFVMCTANIDMENGICNGAQGTIIDFIENSPVIKFNNGITKTLSKHCWQSSDYPTISITQYPLQLAWAITIHKMQGATLESAVMDLGNNVFENGQIYVALSRVKSLEGLYLTEFNPRVITTNPKVRAFYKKIPVLNLEVEYESVEEDADDSLKEESYTEEEPEVAAKPPSKPVAIIDETIINSNLYKQLQTYRTTKAKETGSPPYCIFDNKTMALLTIECPTTIPDLLNIKGIGKVKGEQYGKDIVVICTMDRKQEVTQETKPTQYNPKNKPISKSGLFECLRLAL